MRLIPLQYCRPPAAPVRSNCQINFSNQIVRLADSYYLNFRNTLTTFFLGENQITQLPPDFFSAFKRLLWLNLDNNHIRLVISLLCAEVEKKIHKMLSIYLLFLFIWCICYVHTICF